MDDKAKTDSEKELFEHQIKATDREIDHLVCKLYNITEEEQKIIGQNNHADLYRSWRSLVCLLLNIYKHNAPTELNEEYLKQQ